MAIPNPQPPWGSREEGAAASSTPSGLEPWDPEEALRKEMERLTAENRQISASQETAIQPQPAGGDVLELEKFRAENAELRSIIAELQQHLEASDGAGQADQSWQEKQKEYESLLEEKSELIRQLHLQLQEFQNQKPAAPPTPKEEELMAMSEELERERSQLQQERRQLDDDRKQLREDEEIMTNQMREMEMQMAKERAEIARHRVEIQRINDEIRHELDKIERNRGLNERLTQLRQRHQDVMTRAGTPQGPPGAPQPVAPLPQAQPQVPDDPKRKDSGLLRRFFGQGQ